MLTCKVFKTKRRGVKYLERNIKIDYLKGLALILVVWLHTLPFEDIVIKGLSLGDITDTLAAVGVPIFFMLAGYFYEKKNEKGYLKKYELKLIKPYVISVIFYVLINISKGYFSGVTTDGYLSYLYDCLKSVRLRDFYYTQGYFGYHIWYLPALMLAILVGNFALKKNKLKGWVILGLIFNILGVFIPVLITKTLRVVTRDGIFFGIFYVVLGMYLSKHESKLEKLSSMDEKLHLNLIGLFSITSLLEGFIYVNYFDGVGDYILSTIPLSLLLIGLAFRKDESPIIVLTRFNFLAVLGRNSLLIYLVHPFIIELFYQLLTIINLGWLNDNMIWRLLYTPIVILVSYWLTLGINKLKQRKN